MKEKRFSDGRKRQEKAEEMMMNLRNQEMQAPLFSVQNPEPSSAMSKILASLNSFHPPIMVGMITTSPSKNMDMISRVAEMGMSVNSSGM